MRAYFLIVMYIFFPNSVLLVAKRWRMDKHLTLHIISFVIGGWEPCNTNFKIGFKRQREASESNEESNE
jgi:hypothetical protein